VKESQKELEKLLNPVQGRPCMVHTNLFRAGSLVPRVEDQHELMNLHKKNLERIFDDQLYIPSFTYSYCRERLFDTQNTAAELGPFDEFMRTQAGMTRSLDPVFSMVSRSIDNPEQLPGEIEAFSDQSIFAELYQKDGVILFYGAPLDTVTMIHHAEYLSGRPAYRYDKLFDGRILDAQGQEHQIRYIYPVRPMGKHMDYDWKDIEADLIKNGLLQTFKIGRKMVAGIIEVKPLVDHWVPMLKENMVSLLDDESKAWVEPELDKKGRRFLIDDFE
jgi:aminoglycoside 3-N-acetyltransferase